MAVNQYVIIDGKTKKVNKKYAVIDGKTKKIKKEYVVIDGKTKLIFNPETLQQAIFTASGHFTVPAGVTSVDVFCVGGGGGTGGSFYEYRYSTSNNVNQTMNRYGSGGGGGYTTTELNVSVTPGETLIISVGSAGAGGDCQVTSYFNGTADNSGTTTNGGNGGISSVVRSSNSSIIASASGGKGGLKNSSSNFVAGNDGGSGGGTGGTDFNYSSDSTSKGYTYSQSAGGTDGGNGSNEVSYFYFDMTSNREEIYAGTGGTGQGSTTRFFEEPTGTLYSQGGGRGTVCVANSGNGGGYNSNGTSSVNSSSGIVIIKWIE